MLVNISSGYPGTRNGQQVNSRFHPPGTHSTAVSA
jgi:hypothetical protein